MQIKTTMRYYQTVQIKRLVNKWPNRHEADVSEEKREEWMEKIFKK